MSEQVSLSLSGRNPDVLSCIANLSSDEVFTPPPLANTLLDTVADAWASEHGGADLWADSSVKFLDPFCKSGVFLREIAARLIRGLAEEIPLLEDRVDHVLSKQVYGIAITEITSLMARRSVYCSKFADGEHSVARSFSTPAGNIWFERMEHSWVGDRCKYCNAGSQFQSRDGDLETHAYAFIHTDDVNARVAEIFGEEDMQFDVIVGNPPYQMNDGGAGSSAGPIYQRFVAMAKKLDPAHIAMIIPSRWMAGGKGLDDFRAEMLSDTHIRELVDYHDAAALFPGINLNGGVCYFHWDREWDGPCRFTAMHKTGRVSTRERSLGEHDILVRLNDGLPVLAKVQGKGEDTFDSLVSSRKPFGFPTTFTGNVGKRPAKAVTLYSAKRQGWVNRSDVAVNADLIDSHKVLIPKASDGNEVYPLPVLTEPILAGPGTACNENYLVVGPFDSKAEAERCASYMKTRFFRFLLTLRKPTQDNTRDKFAFIPRVPLDREWSDEALYKRYKITKAEQDYIAEMIREMPS